MRTQLVCTLLAAAALSAPAFAAPPASQDMNAAVASVPVVASSGARRLLENELDDVKGVYKLSDGRTLHVTAENRKLYARLGAAKSELLALAQTRFVTRDDSLRLDFDQIPFATEVTVSEPAR
jgi:hypothetical protein